MDQNIIQTAVGANRDNSIVVRLKAGSGSYTTIIIADFNSIVVRLKDNIE